MVFLDVAFIESLLGEAIPLSTRRTVKCFTFHVLISTLVIEFLSSVLRVHGRGGQYRMVQEPAVSMATIIQKSLGTPCPSLSIWQHSRQHQWNALRVRHYSAKSSEHFYGQTTIPSEFGDRAPHLLDALVKPKRYAAWANPFAGLDGDIASATLAQHGFTRLAGICDVSLWVPRDSEHTRLPKPPTCPHTGLKVYYLLDLASALPALALLNAEVPASASVLDMCAAPGGKLLILAGALFGAGGKKARRLVAIERDRFRFNRLMQNLRLYLPANVLTHILAINGDASVPKTLSGQACAPFDLILVDAPCSSERERLIRALARSNTRTLSLESISNYNLGSDLRWDSHKAQMNAKRQVKLLQVALRNAPRGFVVYSTCALSKMENDDVVAEVLKREPVAGRDENYVDNALLKNANHNGNVADAESTSHGWRVLPDRGRGWGPIYWSVLRGASP